MASQLDVTQGKQLKLNDCILPDVVTHAVTVHRLYSLRQYPDKNVLKEYCDIVIQCSITKCCVYSLLYCSYNI